MSIGIGSASKDGSGCADPPYVARSPRPSRSTGLKKELRGWSTNGRRRKPLTSRSRAPALSSPATTRLSLSTRPPPRAPHLGLGPSQQFVASSPHELVGRVGGEAATRHLFKTSGGLRLRLQSALRASFPPSRASALWTALFGVTYGPTITPMLPSINSVRRRCGLGETRFP